MTERSRRAIGAAPSWPKMNDGTERMLMPTLLSFSWRVVRIFTVWALTKSMHASELDVAAMQDILVIILKASLLALQNKALDVSELLVEDGASSDSEVDEES